MRHSSSMKMALVLTWLFPVALLAQSAAPPAKPEAQAPRPAASSTAKPATPAAKPPAPKPAMAATLTTDEQKTVYALGLAMQRTIASFDLSASELELVKRALSDGSAGKPAVKLDEWGPRIDPLLRDRRERVAIREKASSAA